MNDYRILAVRYLKQNKHRSLITIGGTTLTVLLLYTMLNLGWSYLLNYRQELREEQDYEIVFLTETQEQITALLADDRVQSAYIGQYYWYHYGQEVMYENALYVNTSQPYRMNAIQEQLCTAYGVDADMNDVLAWTYLQGSEGSMMMIIIYFALLVSFIFAIFGVGLIRNSIQLCMLENIRDYGNLRCIGSAKGQLKIIIYLQGLILEGIGILCGTILGTIVSLIAGAVLNHTLGTSMNAGFHMLPFVLVLIVFLGDLYFAMNENCKLVTKMTPISAIRGEYRIRQMKIKNHSHNIIGKIFGVDADYAYKSIMRTPGRFFRTVGALVFGIAASICIMGLFHNIQLIQTERLSAYQYYQMYFRNNFSAGQSIDELESTLPSYDMLEQISESNDVTEAKQLYSADAVVASPDELMEHYTSDYLENSHEGSWRQNMYQKYQEEACTELQWNTTATVECYGYSEAEIARYQSVLTDGTLNLSRHGILLVNQASLVEYTLAIDDYAYSDYTLTDYQVGDTIDLVDMEELNRRVQEELDDLTDDYKAKLEACQEDSEKEEVENWYSQQKVQSIRKCTADLVEEGKVETYTIEGIVSQDVNLYRGGVEIQALRIIMSQDDFFELTGLNESTPTGMLYHLDRFPRTQRIENLVVEWSDEVWEAGGDMCDVSDFVYIIVELLSERRMLLFAAGFVAFVLVMTVLNIINATASNLHLRRKEFAQLRVIGVSKKRLIQMVMLEGVITAVTADVLGILLGTAFSMGIYSVYMILSKESYYFPWAAAGIAVIGTILILCGSIYVSLKRLPQNMAEDLTAGGD